MKWGALLALCVLGSTHAQDIFYPYGTSEGDASLDRNDDGFSGEISLTTPFVFFASEHSSLYVCTNGILSFGAGLSSYTPTPFPIASQPVVAIFWGDVDIRYAGAVYYREVTSGSLLTDLTTVIVDHFGARGQVHSAFQANWAFITTWENVPAYPGSGSEFNTFQAVLVTDGTNSFVVYNYDSVTWTFGSASSGIPAQVGFDAGDGTNFFALPSSRTADIANIDDQTNVGTTGRWMFRVDEAEIIDGGAEPVCNADGCDPHQAEDESGECQDVAPALTSCRTAIDGPFITNTATNQFEFECEFEFTLDDNVALSNYNFVVTWLFNRQPSTDSTRPNTLTITGDQVSDATTRIEGNTVVTTLNEADLYGEHHLGKWLSCGVVSYWSDSPNQLSEQIISSAYWLGVRAMEHTGTDDNGVPQYELLDYLELDESDDSPQNVYLMSTLPIQGFMGTYHQWFLVYSPNTLIVHQDRGRNCSYDFFGEDWNEDLQRVHHHAHPLEVRTISTATTEPMMVDFIEFNERMNPGYDYWRGYSPASVTVYRYNDQDRLPAFCIASGDPRMTTFDSSRYNFNTRGQFVLAESSSSRGFEVHVRTFACDRGTFTASCVCAVAMREGDALYEVHRCNAQDPHDVYDGMIFPFLDDRNWNADARNDTRWVVQRHSSGNDFTVTSPAGAQVRMYWNRNWGYNVYLNIIGADYDRVEGLCGTYNREHTDDYSYRTDRWDSGYHRTNSSVSQADGSDHSEVNDFVQAWRIPRHRSLFETYPPTVTEAEDVTDDRTQYVSCDEPEDDGSDNAGGGSLPPNVGLPLPSSDLITTTGSSLSLALSGSSSSGGSSNAGGSTDVFNIPAGGTFNTGVGQLGRRRRRRSIDDFDFAEDSSNINTNTFPTPSNITEQQATDYCTAELTGGCGTETLDPEVLSGIIDNCVQDVRDLDSLEDVSNTFIGQTQYVCLTMVIQTVNVTGENVTIAEVLAAVDAVLGPIVSSMCVGDCTGHGVCADSTCTCNDGWVGSDCSIDESDLPDVVGFSTGDVCDSSLSSCTAVIVNTDNIYQNPDLMCKVVYGDTEYLMAAVLVNNMQMQCDLPDILAGTSNQLDLSISVSRDGENFGSAASYRMYDGDCLTCISATEDCTIMDDTCSIGGLCYNPLVRNSEALCYQCIPATTQTVFTFEEGCVSSEAGVGEWAEWDDYEGCSVNCDYGWNYRYRGCVVADTCLVGTDTDRMLCVNFRCDEVDEEVDNGCLLTIEGATESVIGQIVDMETSIRSLVAIELNSYCLANPQDCCDLVGATLGTPNMDLFEADDVRIAQGTLYPDITSDSVSMRIAVEIERAAVESACGSAITRRDADSVYVDYEMIEEALEDTYEAFLDLNITLLSIGEEEEVSDEDDSDDKNKEKDHKSNAGIIGAAIGCVLAAIVVVVVIAAIVAYKSKKNRPITPMNVVRHDIPMNLKIKKINVAPPAYDDPDGLAFGPNQAPPVRDTRGQQFW